MVQAVRQLLGELALEVGGPLLALLDDVLGSLGTGSEAVRPQFLILLATSARGWYTPSPEIESIGFPKHRLLAGR
jgi:hypothetical protein